MEIPLPVNPDLEAENRALMHMLKTLNADAAHNEAVMSRCQEREMSLLTAEGLIVLLQHLTTGMKQSFGLDAVSLALLDPYHVLRDLLSGLGFKEKDFPEISLIDDLSKLHDYGFQNNQPTLGPWKKELHKHLFSQLGLKSVAVLPMRRVDGPVGCLNLASHDIARFHEKQATDFLDRLASIAAVCLENAVNRERLRLTGLTDPLTGLYNRRYLEQRLDEELSRCVRHEQSLSCLFIDADHFKNINDTYGHTAGDAVLVELARRIRTMLRTSDLATRYGGEEFALILPSTRATEAVLLAERMRQSIANEVFYLRGGGEINVTVSIGVSEISPARHENLETLAQQLIDSADAAVYLAKEQGRNQVCLMSETVSLSSM